MTDLREQEMQSQIDALSSTAENWKNTAKNLKTENQMLKAQVAQLQKMVYGSRTEKTKRILPETADGQLNLFNEAEVEAKRNAPEPCIEVPAHQRRKKQKDHTAELLAKFPHEDWLMPLVSRLQQDLLQQDVIHADETPVQVHKEKGRKVNDDWIHKAELSKR